MFLSLCHDTGKKAQVYNWYWKAVDVTYPHHLTCGLPLLSSPHLSSPFLPSLLTFGFMWAADFEKWIADYFRNKYLDMEYAWWGKAGLSCCATVSMQGRSGTVIAVSWTNCIFYAIKGNLFVDLEMQLTHILMDSSLLSVGFPDLFSLFVWRSNPEDTALKTQTERKQRRRGKRMSVIWEDLAWDKDRT